MSTPSQIPTQVRSKLADTIEDIGEAMGLLRESIEDAEHGNIGGSKLAASDALEIISTLESRFSQLTADLARWSES